MRHPERMPTGPDGRHFYPMHAQEHSAVLVVKLDRVMRSLQIFLKELEDFASMRVSLISLDYGDLNPASASGKLSIQFLAAIAEWERAINSERTREALAQKRAQGVPLGRPTKALPIHKVALLRAEPVCASWSEIARQLNIPRTTILEHRKEIEEEVKRIELGQ